GLIPGLLLAALTPSWASIGLGIVTPLAGLAAAWALARSADAKMDATFSAFWHRIRPKLREAFRRVREGERSQLQTPPPPPPVMRFGSGAPPTPPGREDGDSAGATRIDD